MRRLFQIIKAVIMKAATAVLLSVLTLFKVFLKIATPLFRWITIPVVFFGLIITAAMYLDNGYAPSQLIALTTFATMTGLYFVLPLVPDLIGCTQMRMKEYIRTPIVVRSPVKFTL